MLLGTISRTTSNASVPQCQLLLPIVKPIYTYLFRGQCNGVVTSWKWNILARFAYGARIHRDRSNVLHRRQTARMRRWVCQWWQRLKRGR
jgi:hypothetical protein